MAEIKKDNQNMEFPLQIARQYPAPLDKYSVFYSMEEAIEYAKNSPLAYVGQIISVVDEGEGEDPQIEPTRLFTIEKDGVLRDVADVRDIDALYDRTERLQAQNNTIIDRVEAVKESSYGIASLVTATEFTVGSTSSFSQSDWNANSDIPYKSLTNNMTVITSNGYVGRISLIDAEPNVAVLWVKSLQAKPKNSYFCYLWYNSTYCYFTLCTSKEISDAKDFCDYLSEHVYPIPCFGFTGHYPVLGVQAIGQTIHFYVLMYDASDNEFYINSNLTSVSAANAQIYIKKMD